MHYRLSGALLENILLRYLLRYQTGNVQLQAVSMLDNRSILVSDLYIINPTFIGFEENLVVGQFSFSLFFTGHLLDLLHLSERTETGLITKSYQTRRAVNSCNRFFIFSISMPTKV